jgi:16S rRNA (cytidine1402-2'-O)-methyltransferase
VALVSDAGTPALSDPGYELVRAALAAGYLVIPIPGPSALLAALVASGLPTDSFVYLGFLPRSAAERRRLLTSLATESRTLVAFEAPHRLLEALEDIETALGDRPLAVGRELTKMHEEIYRGLSSAARQHFAQDEIRGEITLVIAGAATTTPPGEAEVRWPEERVRQEMEQLLAGGMKRREAARQVAQASGWTPRAVYQLSL